MFKYRINEINIQHINGLFINKLKNKYNFKFEFETFLLCGDGKYKILENEIEKLKFKDKDSEISEFKKYTFILDENKWTKYCDEFKIPYLHDKIEIKKIIFNIKSDTQNTITIELLNNEIHDCFFLTGAKITDNNYNDFFAHFNGFFELL